MWAYEPDVYPHKTSGFEVPGIESSVNQLRYEHREAIEWVTDRFKIAGMIIFHSAPGIRRLTLSQRDWHCGQIDDHFNNIFCELFATKAETPATAKGQLQFTWSRRS